MTRRPLLFALTTLAFCVGQFGLTSVADALEPESPRRIGVLLGGFLPAANNAKQFRQGLLDAGYAEGRDVVIEWRSADGDFARLPSLVADLVQRKVEVIVVITTAAAQAAKGATSTTPIVMTVVADPVRSGVVTNLAHPDGNVTELSMMMSELTSKRLQLLKEAIPRLRRVAVLGNPGAPYYPNVVEDLKAVAPSLAIELSFVGARTPEEFGPAFSGISRMHAQALYVVDDPLFFTYRAQLLKLALRARLREVASVFWTRA